MSRATEFGSSWACQYSTSIHTSFLFSVQFGNNKCWHLPAALNTFNPGYSMSYGAHGMRISPRYLTEATMAAAAAATSACQNTTHSFSPYFGGMTYSRL